MTEKRLRIALLHYASAPVIGGVESIMSTHARLLASAGHTPFIVTGRGDSAQAGLDGAVIPEIDSRHPEVAAAQGALLRGEEGAEERFEACVSHIRTLLETTLADFDLCIVHNALTLHKNVALTAALARMSSEGTGPRAWIAWCHDLAWTNPLYESELKDAWPWSLLAAMQPGITYVAVSPQRQDEMAVLFGVPPASIKVVPNGIEPSAYIPSSPALTSLRKRLDWDGRDVVLLVPVRITRRKNIELAVDVASALRGYNLRPLVVVTGPPGPHNTRSHEYLDELLSRRRDRGVEGDVAFLAVEGGEEGGLEVSDALMAELYWWADALFLPSTQEGFGLPLLEAGLARLPVFSSDLEVLREVGGPYARYFDPGGDPARIAAQIASYLMESNAAAYRRHVLSTYSWDAIFAARMLPLVERAAAESAPRISGATKR